MNQYFNNFCMSAGNLAGDCDNIAECPVTSPCITPGITAADLDVMYIELVFIGVLQKSIESTLFYIIFNIKIQVPGSFSNPDIKF